MRIRPMGSQGNGCGGGGDGKQIHIDFFAKQSSSLCSLTLNEVQDNLGEPLQSMNLDKLLKNIFPQEVNPSAFEDLEMSRFVSKKIMNEVWREGQQQMKKDGNEPQQKSTFGEMTLEDFLVKAGVVADDSDERSDGTRESHCLQQSQQKQCITRSYVPSRPVLSPMDISASNAILDAVHPDSQLNISSPLLSGRKRVAREEMAEKAGERRQKRMIKNRESAARSRARKQAYTSELENTILRLEEENERLGKQKELDIFRYCVPLPEPKQQLRRSISAPF